MDVAGAPQSHSGNAPGTAMADTTTSGHGRGLSSSAIATISDATVPRSVDMAAVSISVSLSGHAAAANSTNSNSNNPAASGSSATAPYTVTSPNAQAPGLTTQDGSAATTRPSLIVRQPSAATASTGNIGQTEAASLDASSRSSTGTHGPAAAVGTTPLIVGTSIDELEALRRSSQVVCANPASNNAANEPGSQSINGSSINNQSATKSTGTLSGRPKFTENRYTIYADPAESAASASVVDVVKCLVEAGEYRLVSSALTPSDVNALVNLLDPTDRHRLAREYRTVFSEDELAKIRRGNTALLVEKLGGEAGLKVLARPIVVCPLAGTIVIGNQVEEIRNMLRESGWEGGRGSVVATGMPLDPSAGISSGMGFSSLNASVSARASAASAASSSANTASARASGAEHGSTNRAVILPSNMSVHAVNASSSFSASSGGGKPKYIVYHDPQDPESAAIFSMITSKVPPNLYKVVSGPLDRREIKTIQYNLEPGERATLCRHADKLLTANEQLRIRQDDVEILSAKLSGPAGLQHLCRPIVVCPVAGTIVIGNKPDKVSQILEEDGWHSSLTSTVTVNVQRTSMSLHHMALGIRRSLSRNSNQIRRSPSVASATSVASVATTGTTGSVGPKSKYTFVHDPANPHSVMLLEQVRTRAGTTAEVQVVTGPLTPKDIKPMLHLIEPRNHLSLLVKHDVLSAADQAKVKSGRPDVLVAAVTGESGLANLVRPILMCPLLGTIMVGYRPDEIDAVMSDDVWGLSGSFAGLGGPGSGLEPSPLSHDSLSRSSGTGSATVRRSPSMRPTSSLANGSSIVSDTSSTASGHTASIGSMGPSTTSQLQPPSPITGPDGATHSRQVSAAPSTASALSTRPVPGIKYTLYHDPDDQKSLEVYRVLSSSCDPAEYRVLTTPLTPHDIRTLLHMIDANDRLSLCRSTVGLLDKTEMDKISRGDLDVLARKLSGDAGIKYLFRPILMCPIAGSVVVGARMGEVMAMLQGGNMGW
ncbi:hypothetical protein BC831DRAFT_463380 [Entophlyctis helioformis]|nr:hypothetical protein BC831DRAFT_463380 [Entophlyctis helioformis]